MASDAPILILFAKTPTPGTVKTRLQPALTPGQAVQVAELLIEQTVLRAKSWPGPVELAVWPDQSHPLFQRLSREHGLRCRPQVQGDLGEKMAAALTAATARGRPAAILGCDVPHCPATVLKDACRRLRSGSAVLGPSSDGGYYLIGMGTGEPALFHGIPWGTDQVLQRTRERAAALDLSFYLLPVLTDLDTWAELRAARNEVGGLARLLDSFAAPAWHPQSRR